MCRRISFSPLNPRRVGPPTTGTEIIGGFVLTKQKDRLGLSEINQLVLVMQQMPQLASSFSVRPGLTRRGRLRRAAAPPEAGSH
jgi:hypothetical protein